ncbi:MAG: hypothetical protein ACYCQI_04860 [Gammaproteobacteria bacterium]
MKKIFALGIAALICFPTLSFAHSCPDPSTIEIKNHIVTPPQGYILNIIFPINKDKRSDLYKGNLITRIIDSERLELTTIECYYSIGGADDGVFMLSKHFLGISTTDSALKQTGWEERNRRKWFECRYNHVNTCIY